MWWAKPVSTIPYIKLGRRLETMQRQHNIVELPVQLCLTAQIEHCIVNILVKIRIGQLWNQKTLTSHLLFYSIFRNKVKNKLSFVKILVTATFLLAHWAAVTVVVLKIWYHGQALVMEDSVGKRRFCGWLW